MLVDIYFVEGWFTNRASG